MAEIIVSGSLVSVAEINEDLYTRFTRYIDASPKTIETYTRALRQFSRYCTENRITAPQREDIISYRKQLAERCKPTTIQMYITALRLFFQWTAQEGIYPNIAEHIKGAKLDREHKKDCLTSTQVKRLLSSIDRSTDKGKRDYSMILLMTVCGLRDIEVSRANIEDLSTVADSSVLYVQGKGRQERTEYVKIPAPVEDALREYLASRENKAPGDPLFCSTSNNNHAGRLTTRSISGTVKSCLKNAGYDSDRITAHSLRHTAVTLSLLAGRPLEEVQQFARHSNISTTMIYNHALDRARNQCSDAVMSSIL